MGGWREKLAKKNGEEWEGSISRQQLLIQFSSLKLGLVPVKHTTTQVQRRSERRYFSFQSNGEEIISSEFVTSLSFALHTPFHDNSVASA